MRAGPAAAPPAECRPKTDRLARAARCARGPKGGATATPAVGSPQPLHRPIASVLLLAVAHAVALAAALQMTAALAAANQAPDFPLEERPIAQEIAAAPVIVEGSVLTGGSFQAIFDVDTVYKADLPGGASRLPRTLRIAGFNSIAGDRAARAMRPGERIILFLAPAGDMDFTPRSGGGRFDVEAATEYGAAKVVASLGDPNLLVPLDPEHFRILLRAILAAQSEPPAPTLIQAPASASAQAAVAAGTADRRQTVQAGVDLARLSLTSSNPVHEYFGVVLARSLSAVDLLPELMPLGESSNARIQAETLDTLAELVQRFGPEDARFDRTALMRLAGEGLSAKVPRTRLAAARLMQELPAAGAARQLMTFYRDAAADFQQLPVGDSQRSAFLRQQGTFWLSPALLNDPGAQDALLDFAAGNDAATATGALAVLGQRGASGSLAGLADLLTQPDFKFTADAKIALFRIALSDEVLQPGVDLTAWAAATEKTSYAERLAASLRRVDRLLNQPASGSTAGSARATGLLLCSCLPGEVGIPRLIAQTVVAPAALPPVLFARTQSPLALPYLSRAFLTGDDTQTTAASDALEGWVELEPLVRFGCDDALGVAAARQSMNGANVGVDAAADLLAPGAEFGLTAGFALDGSVRGRGHRFQVLQQFTGQSFGWGENEIDWNTRLCLWSTWHAAQVTRFGGGAYPPALEVWVRQAQARLAPDFTPAQTEAWLNALSAPDPREARAGWRNLATALLRPEPDITPSPLVEGLWRKLVQRASDSGNLQAACLAVDVLGLTRAPVGAALGALLRPTTPAVLRHQLWWALGRVTAAPGDWDPAVLKALLVQIRTLAGDRHDPIESTLAVWALRALPGATVDGLLGELAGSGTAPAEIRRTAAAALLWRACRQPLDAILPTLTAAVGALPSDDDLVQSTLLTAIGADQGDLDPTRRDVRLIGLTHILAQATANNFDLPSNLLRAELDPQPYAGPAAYQLDAATRRALRSGLKAAFQAAAQNDPGGLSDIAERAYGFAWAVGAWPCDDFKNILADAVRPDGAWPQTRTRTVCYALEGLAAEGGTVPAATLRMLLQNGDDRLAAVAARLLARVGTPDDMTAICARFNTALPKTQRWFDAVGATGLPQVFQFLSDATKSEGFDGFEATEALGLFDSDGARILLTQSAADLRRGNRVAAVLGWARQLTGAPDRMTAVAAGPGDSPLTFCDAIEWVPSSAAAAGVAPLLKLCASANATERRRADLALSRVTGLPAWCSLPSATAAGATAEALTAYWRAKIGP
ncbi:MAG: hypothetical protein ACREJ2_03815 [Planctomycetota bacterium]